MGSALEHPGAADEVAGDVAGAAAWRHLRVDAGAVTLDVAVAEPAVTDPPVLLLVSGLGSQRTEWPQRLLDRCVSAGLRVVIFDHRDCGASTALDDRPGDAEDVARWQRGEPFAVPYTLTDLAHDALAVLDHLGVARAHVLGRSMGGMVAQRLAAAVAPDRVASLTSVMSTTGAPGVGEPWPGVVAAMTQPTPDTRTEVLAAKLARARLTAGPRFDEAATRSRLAAAYDRAHRPEGTTRQLLAVLADGDRTALLRQVAVPTLVVHGAADAMVDVSGGRATAAAIAGARLLVFDGMGHDLPVSLLDPLADAVLDHVLGAEAHVPR